MGVVRGRWPGAKRAEAVPKILLPLFPAFPQTERGSTRFFGRNIRAIPKRTPAEGGVWAEEKRAKEFSRHMRYASPSNKTRMEVEGRKGAGRGMLDGGGRERGSRLFRV